MAVGDTESRGHGHNSSFSFDNASPAKSRRSTRHYTLPQPNWERPLSEVDSNQNYSDPEAFAEGTTCKLPTDPSPSSIAGQEPPSTPMSQMPGTPSLNTNYEGGNFPSFAPQSVQTPSDKKERVCRACNESISGHFVRALGSSWHIDCFHCADCNEPCAKKFFPDPSTAPGTDAPYQKPLCERCYFSRLDLLCFRCSGALRGSYITALGRKYHIEHFTCSICPLNFGPDDSYYEHNGDVFCQFHYSKLHAASCEGCNGAILKQFVETYRGGVEHQWHPECYMIFKFWNVKISSAVVAPKLEMASFSDTPTDQQRTLIADHDAYIDNLVLDIWSTLCGFEETSAAAISQMLQCAVNHSYDLALSTTISLVSSVQVLFEAIQELTSHPNAPKLGKEPKTLCRKVVAYMSIVSKARQTEQYQSPDLLGIANSLAHYLKVLIRFGLSTALGLDKGDMQYQTLHTYLATISKYRNPAPPLTVSALTSDRCVTCQKTVEDNCYCSRDRLWHTACFVCSSCGTEMQALSPGTRQQLPSTPAGDPLCAKCSVKLPVTVDSEFRFVGRLSQYVFLLHVAIARFELVLGQSDAHDASPNSASISTPSLVRKQDGHMNTQMPSFRKGSTEEANDKHYQSSVSDARSVRDKQDKCIISGNAETMATTTTSTSSANGPGMTSDSGQSLPTTAALARTSDLLHSKSALTLDDIRRIVAAEQARDQMPNAYRHQQQGVEDMLEISAKVNSESGEVPNYFANINKEDYRLLSKIATHKLFDLLVPKYMTQEELNAVLLPPQQSIWAKMGKALGPSRPKRFGVFGIDLDTLIEKSGVDSTLGVGGYTLRIPAFLEEVIAAMRQKDMSIEGVFRKNGNIKRIRDFQDIADKGVDIGGMLAEENIIQLAALLKTFLREMPSPLMGAKAGTLCTLSIKVEPEEREPLMRLLMCLLDRECRDTLEVLMTFLNWSASFSSMDEDSGSKMDAHNLATVITPNILGAKEGVQPDHYLKAIEAVAFLIKNHTCTARVPADVYQIMTQIKESRPKEKLGQKEVSDFIRSLDS